jgi:hypothetical protein
MRRSLPALLGPALSVAPAAAQHLRVGIASDPDVLDPTRSRTVAARQVFMAMCDKLVDIHEQGCIVPQLAAAWAWEEDGRALHLTLHPGVAFHDGVPLDAEATAAGLRRHLTAQGSTRRGEMSPGAGGRDRRPEVGPRPARRALRPGEPLVLHGFRADPCPRRRPRPRPVARGRACARADAPAGPQHLRYVQASEGDPDHGRRGRDRH